MTDIKAKTVSGSSCNRRPPKSSLLNQQALCFDVDPPFFDVESNGNSAGRYEHGGQHPGPTRYRVFTHLAAPMGLYTQLMQKGA